MNEKISRPKIGSDVELEFEIDIMKVLEKYGVIKKGVFLQKAKIFISSETIPFIETKVFVNNERN